MTFKKIFLFYFSIVFNIFSDYKIKFIVKIQDVVNNGNGECLKDIFSKEISIGKDKLNKDKYKSEELIDLLGVNDDSELKTQISNKNFLIEIAGRIFFKDEEIADEYLKDEKYKSREIKFRDKRKYDFKLYNRCKVKDKITVNNKNGSKDYSKQDFIHICDLIDKRLNNDDCCFLEERDVYFITLNYDILKVKFGNKIPYDIKNNYIYFYDNNNIYCNNIECVVISNNNEKFNVKIISAKNLYDVVTFSTSKLEKTDGSRVRYIDIKEVKYNENKSFNFNEKLKKYNVDEINEELKKIDVDIYKIFTMILNIGFRKKEIEKEKKEDKKLTYCQRVKC